MYQLVLGIQCICVISFFNTDFIRSHTKKLLSGYRALNKELSPLDRSDEDKLKLSEGMRKNAFQAIIEIAHNMDFGMMEYLLQDLKSYELSSEDADIVKQIEGMLVELDWDGIEKAAKAGMGLK